MLPHQVGRTRHRPSVKIGARFLRSGQLRHTSNESTQIVTRDQADGAGGGLGSLPERVRDGRLPERQILGDLDHRRSVVERGAGRGVDTDVRVRDEPQDLRVRGPTQQPNTVKQAPRREIRTECLELATPAGNSQPNPRQPVVDDEALEDLRQLVHTVLRFERADVHQLRVHESARADRWKPP